MSAAYDTSAKIGNTRTGLFASFPTALLFAAVDLAFSLLNLPKELLSLTSVFPPLAATTIVALLVYNVLWFVVVSPVAAAFGLHRRACAAALSVLFLTFFSVGHLTQWGLGLVELFRGGVVIVVSLLASIGAYSFVRGPGAGRWGGMLLAAANVAPIAFLGVTACIWLNAFRNPPLVLNLIIVIVTFAVLAGFVIRRAVAPSWKLTLSATILVFLSPLSMLFAGNGSPVPQALYREGHSVKRVLLIIVDTLRADALSCYNKSAYPSPNIDQLSADGVVFENALSAGPWTLPGVASIMTGLSPSTHLAIHRRSILPPAAPTVAEAMEQDGYMTAAIGKNNVLNPSRNLIQGFQEYDFYPKPSGDTSLGKKVLRRLFPEAFRIDVSTTDLANLTIDWIEKNRENEWFLWLHFFDPHHPFTPPEKYLPDFDPPPFMDNTFAGRLDIQRGVYTPTLEERDWIRELYLAEVRYVDDNIGRITDKLKALGLYDDTLIILTSDHGEEFWEHGGFEHGHTLYNELLNVPLIVKLPGNGVKDRVQPIVGTQSIAPTILDVCNGGPSDFFSEVPSLSPFWKANRDTIPPAYINSTGLLYGEDEESVASATEKYIRSRVTDREELFNLVTDPGEQHSIAHENPASVLRAREFLDNHSLSAEKNRDFLGIKPGDYLKLDEESIKRMRALGYM